MKKKLVLHKETLQRLTGQEMEKVVGGSWFYTCATCDCGTANTCNDNC